MFSITAVVPDLPRIKVIDVGAMKVGEDDAYSRLVAACDCEVVGFEPVAAALERLRAMAEPGRTYLPHVVGDGSRQVFHETSAPMTSSLFEPDPAVFERFQALGEALTVVNRTPVDTVRLDDIPEVAGADYLKLDVQGAELMALGGATETLKGVVAIHTEVEFVPLYRGQPLFADIDAFLRARGFLFHRFTGIAGRTFKPLLLKDPGAAMSQSLWGEAVFVRDFRTFDDLLAPSLLKLAAILHENYGSLDLAVLALSAYDKRAATTLNQDYLGRLTRPTT